MEALAKAHTNIALIKYWGKRDETLFLPMNSSLSITLDAFYTTTSVEFCSCLKSDMFVLNGNLTNEEETKKISNFLDKVRALAGVNLHAMVSSVNNVPTSAGFASSASGFAALALAATKAIGLDIDHSIVSRIARQGSGSACRSVYGGYVEWEKGVAADGSDSYASPIMDGEAWDLSILSVMVDSRNKKVLSREGMKRTVDTSPFYSGWLDTVEEDLEIAKGAIINRDFGLLGKVVEANALKMHATTLGADPPFTYFQGATLDVMEAVKQMRAEGVPVYFTIDAGPNVKVLCQPENEAYVQKVLAAIPTVQSIYLCHPGPGAKVLSRSSLSGTSKKMLNQFHHHSCTN
ncbi:diphosphomevalonate decarboxylase [Aquibacillus kalidii]|uniref:diphosphomevalonate decarboxylase n=1 Tax=Aquibacillus kalidii TaxID=2762597 RepID=UPI00164782EB|nr:diphosphomevalonate decarboxylase [Aquibacillus kalidii]